MLSGTIIMELTLVRRTTRRLALACALAVAAVPCARAANRITVGTAGANAGTPGVSVDISITNDQPIHAYSLALTYDASVLTLKQLTDEGTATAPLNPEFFYPTINNNEGTAVLGVIFSYNDDPFTRVELAPSPDTPQRVAVLTFDIAAGAPPGDYVVKLQNGVGSPPISNAFSQEGMTIRPQLESGAVTVNNENILQLDSAEVRPGSRFELKASAKHPATLQGFSIAFTFDKALLTFVDATYAGTAVALALRPQVIEFFAPEVDMDFSPERARLTVGAVLDFVPPFTGHEIPPSVAQFQSLTRFIFDARSGDELIGSSTELIFHNAGVTSFNTIFVIDEQTFTPATIDGVVRFTAAPVFRRGYVNPDQRVDISDGIVILGHSFLGWDPPACLQAGDLNDDNRFDVSDAVWLFTYLFAGGARPKDPFLNCGADPTPGDLPCGQVPQCP